MWFNSHLVDTPPETSINYLVSQFLFIYLLSYLSVCLFVAVLD